MSLTDTVFGTPGTTTVNQAPGTKPPGYQFARDFYGSLGSIASNPFPTYQGQLDPGLSPTLQNLLRQAQGYAQSGPPEILAGVQGSLGQFMNPSFANPMARLQLGAPDYFNQNPNQTVYNGGAVNGLAGIFGQTGSGMSGAGQGGGMQRMSGQPFMQNQAMQGQAPQTQGGAPPFYAGGQQPPYMQGGTQGLQNAFQGPPAQGSAQGFHGPPPGITQGVGGLSGSDQVQHRAGGFDPYGGFSGAPGQINLPGYTDGGLQFPGQPGEINFQWPGNGPGPGYNPGSDGGFHGIDPGSGWYPHPSGQFPTNGAPGGHTYGGYTASQLQANPALAARLGAHAAGLWRAFSGQPGGGVPVTGPNTRHPLNPAARHPVGKPLRNPMTGGIAAQPGG